MQDLISMYTTETVAYDGKKAEFNKQENDFSTHEFADKDGRGSAE